MTRREFLEVLAAGFAAGLPLSATHAANDARSKGAWTVVLLSHNGMDVDLKLASRVTGLDAILGGQSYTFVSPMGDSVRYLLGPAKMSLLNFGVLTSEML